MSPTSLLPTIMNFVFKYIPLEPFSRVKIGKLSVHSSHDGFIYVYFTVFNNSDDAIVITHAESYITTNWYSTFLCEFWSTDGGSNYTPPPAIAKLDEQFPIDIQPKNKREIQLKADNKSIASASFTIHRKKIWKGEPEYYLQIK